MSDHYFQKMTIFSEESSNKARRKPCGNTIVLLKLYCIITERQNHMITKNK